MDIDKQSECVVDLGPWLDGIHMVLSGELEKSTEKH